MHCNVKKGLAQNQELGNRDKTKTFLTLHLQYFFQIALKI